MDCGGHEKKEIKLFLGVQLLPPSQASAPPAQSQDRTTEGRSKRSACAKSGVMLNVPFSLLNKTTDRPTLEACWRAPF